MSTDRNDAELQEYLGITAALNSLADDFVKRCFHHGHYLPPICEELMGFEPPCHSFATPLIYDGLMKSMVDAYIAENGI